MKEKFSISIKSQISPNKLYKVIYFYSEQIDLVYYKETILKYEQKIDEIFKKNSKITEKNISFDECVNK